MSLKTVFKTMKNEGYVIKPMEKYLMSLASTDEDRAIDVNAPSQLGACLRSRYYARTKAERDGCAVDPRSRRILDNGTGVHERLQGYLRQQGMLLIDEVPVLNEEYNIQGHTDGILRLTPDELGILEIKSINSNGFSNLKSAKLEHKMQGLIYVYCIEERRKWLHEMYGEYRSDKPRMSSANRKKFDEDRKRRGEYLSQFYQHLKAGKRYTREEKIQFQLNLHDSIDSILFNTENPITKAIFLYENKDTQELKEFTISSEEAESKVLLKNILGDCAFLNDSVANEKLPDREGKSKSDGVCRWCPFKTECWG